MNLLARYAYRCAYRAARIWWFIRRPRTVGAIVALWNDGRLLLVRSSYRTHYALPGGFVKRGEAPQAAAARELAEELRVVIPPAALTLGWHGSRSFEHRTDTVTIWEVVLDVPPSVQVNGREIVWAGWKTPAEARELLLLPHIRDYLDAR